MKIILMKIHKALKNAIFLVIVAQLFQNAPYWVFTHSPKSKHTMTYLKWLSVIVNSKLHFFPNPQIFFFFFFFLHIQRELHCKNLPIPQLSRKQHIFGKKDNSLLLRIIIPSVNWLKPVFLVRNHLKLDFLMF